MIELIKLNPRDMDLQERYDAREHSLFIDERTKVYLAGLFDSYQGCIAILQFKYSDKKRIGHRLSVSIESYNKEFVERIMNVTGLGSVTTCKRLKKGVWIYSYSLRMFANDAMRFLVTIRPYSFFKDRIDLALEFQRRMLIRYPREEVSDEEWKVREDLRLLIKFYRRDRTHRDKIKKGDIPKGGIRITDNVYK